MVYLGRVQPNNIYYKKKLIQQQKKKFFIRVEFLKLRASRNELDTICQLISKAIYGLLTSPKKRTDEFDLFAF